MHGLLFKDTHFGAEDASKLNNVINICLIKWKIVFFIINH